jgi:hypothetical protein
LAIDTPLKRASVQAMTLGLTRPFPDGTVSAADRAMVAWFYAGLTYSAVAAWMDGSMTEEEWWMRRRRLYRKARPAGWHF